MENQLSTGAISDIMTGGKVEKPVLQVLGTKRIPGNNSDGTDRYRLLLSDGQHSTSSTVVATQLNSLITSGDLDDLSVIRLDRFICNTISPERRVMILLEVAILAKGADIGKRKLGEPMPLKAGVAANTGSGGPAPMDTSHNQPKPSPYGNTAKADPKSQATGTGAPKAGFYGKENQNKNFGGQAPKTPGGTPAKVHPIAALTPYQNRWTIRARVTNKSAVRTWSNSRGEGKLFSMNFVDESGEIRATAFKDEVDKFYEFVELNKVYYISKATLKNANKQYSSVNNDYEMTFNGDTQMILCEEEVDLPQLSFNFVKINELDKHQANSIIDVIGVVRDVADLSTVVGKQSNREIKKRDVTIVDESKVQVRLTLWGEEAEKFKGENFPIIAVKGCRLSDWGGRSLSVLGSSQLIERPDIPEAHRLRGWYDTYGHNVDYDEFRGEGTGTGSATNWKMFADVKSENLGQGEKADFYTVKASVVFLRKENCMYQACPSAECNKKVVDQSNGTYRCEKCNKQYPNFKWRMILSVNLADCTDNTWVTCFQETAELILAKSADEIGALKQNDDVAFDNLFMEASFKSYIFKLRAKMENYNDENRLKTVCVTATPVDWKDYNTKLIGDIETLLKGS